MLSVLHIRKQIHSLRLIFTACFLVLLLQLLSPSAVRAQSIQHTNLPPTLDVSQATNTLFRDNYWATIQVTISHVSTPLSGFLRAQMCVFSGRGTTQPGVISPWNYQVAVQLRKGEQKQFSLALPHSMGNFDAQGVLVTLLDTQGKEITHTLIGQSYEVLPPDILIGALSDQADTLNMNLIRVALPNQKDSLTTVPLDATTFPTQSTLLSIYTIMILDDFSSNTLSHEQLAALRTWVNQGGILIEIGGTQWQRTLASLPADLLPISLSGTKSLSAGIALYTDNSPSSDLYFAQSAQAPDTVTISTGTRSNTFSNNEVLASASSIPLILKARFGQGMLCYLAYDPMQAPLLTWAGQPDLWQMLLFATLGSYFLIPDTAATHTTGPGDFLTHTGILRLLSPEALFGPWVLLLLLIVYVTVMGMGFLFAMRRLPQMAFWHWRLLLVSILLFSLVSYSFAFYQKDREVSDNTVSLLRLNQEGSFAHITTYHGLFTPSHTSFTLHLPVGNLAQPLSNNLLTYTHLSHASGEAPFSLTYTTSGTSVQVHNTASWLLHPLVTESDTAFQGRIAADLSLAHGHLVGIVTNTLATPLTDLYVLFSHGFARIGSLLAGESRTVDLPLSLTSAGFQPLFADQIAQQGGLSTPYFPYTKSQAPQSDFERHMALLSALSGVGTASGQCAGSCNKHAIVASGTAYFSDVHLPNPGQVDVPDPLLLSGTSATLIGWMGQNALPGNEVTINANGHLQGHHENFLQMPLSLSISSLDQIPANFIQGQVVDVEGFDAQVVLPGVYTFSDGGLTFELPVPPILHQQPGGLTIAIPNLLASPRGLDRFSTVANLQVLIYNWQMNRWDSIHLQQNSFSSRNIAAYLGQNQRVLVFISNDVNNLGRLIFGSPSLSLQR